ncbi:DUF433 domain-containing protein [Longimicrobium sp.]|uniref:DUF433 domain-containing protein n=1 Tax=Longimicrobium sp. TaxID=2029185 RepID=UPI002E30ED59|nr:DUF433 domain-containing protein [Longimicrobium sp.]HEX6039564.1 DUF433 domain-containing protein [Longimicrobium sp.]
MTELSRKTIDQAIDRKEVLILPSPGGGEPPRLLGYPELVYLRVRRDVAGTLTASARETVYRVLRQRLPQAHRLGYVDIGPVRVSLTDAVTTVRERLAKVWRARRHVSIRPDVRAGEPVVRGTRVPVYVLSDLTAQGASREELLEDYPAITRESLDAALLFAQLHPRRGPRRQAPWRAGPPLSSTQQ